jgi:hypothetical protein
LSHQNAWILESSLAIPFCPWTFQIVLPQTHSSRLPALVLKIFFHHDSVSVIRDEEDFFQRIGQYSFSAQNVLLNPDFFCALYGKSILLAMYLILYILIQRLKTDFKVEV